MRHRVAGRHLGRTPSHRRALRRNMAASLIEHGAIRTTEAKAKELRRFVEKLITTAKKGTLHARRQIISKLQDRQAYDKSGEEIDQTVVQKLFSDIAPRYVDRPGGYTRIIRLADRRIGDAGKQVLIQLVEESSVSDGLDKAGQSSRKQRAAKRIEAAGKVAPNTEEEKTEEPIAETDETPVAEEPSDEETPTPEEEKGEQE